MIWKMMQRLMEQMDMRMGLILRSTLRPRKRAITYWNSKSPRDAAKLMMIVRKLCWDETKRNESIAWDGRLTIHCRKFQAESAWDCLWISHRVEVKIPTGGADVYKNADLRRLDQSMKLVFCLVTDVIKALRGPHPGDEGEIAVISSGRPSFDSRQKIWNGSRV